MYERRRARTNEAFVAGLDSTGVPYKGNYVDHNSFQDNITAYLQQPDDVFTWFSGYRMRFFADKGLTGDISDVWANLPDFSDSFKAASTGNDGKQYLVPTSYYPWAVHYRKSLFEEKGYTIPTTKDELVALATKMKDDGLIPFAYANDGKWPVQGTFDILNLRLNGYQFHVDLLAGKEDWTERQGQERVHDMDRAAAVPPGEPQRAHVAGSRDSAWRTRKPGCSSSARSSPATRPIQTYLDDLDFFNYPEFDPAIGATRSMHRIDGFMMAAKPEEPRRRQGAAGRHRSRRSTSTRTSAVNPSSVPANSKADTSKFNKIQTKSAELVGSAKFVSQFLDRDTSPDFVSNVIGDAFANFHADPTQIDSILADIEAQKSTYLG